MVNVDDVVLIKTPNKTRPYWLLGRILELIKGDDDKIRSVKLKRGDGKIVIHSLKHLYPLELSLTHNVKFSSGKNKESEEFEISQNKNQKLEEFENPQEKFQELEEFENPQEKS